MKDQLKKFSTEELDILYSNLGDEDSNLRDQVKNEIYSRVDKLKKNGKKGKA